MFATVLVLAALAIPFVLDLYFSLPEESVEEEYIPDGR